MPIWDDIKRELANLWEILTTGEAQTPPEETPEEEPETGGGFFDEPPEKPPPSGGGIFDEGFWYEPDENPGPYPDNWGPAEERFWDKQMDDYFFQDESQYERAQEAFYDGYMAQDDEITHEDRMVAREEFLDITYLDAIDWEAFQEYYDSI